MMGILRQGGGKIDERKAETDRERSGKTDRERSVKKESGRSRRRILSYFFL